MLPHLAIQLLSPCFTFPPGFGDANILLLPPREAWWQVWQQASISAEWTFQGVSWIRHKPWRSPHPSPAGVVDRELTSCLPVRTQGRCDSTMIQGLTRPICCVTSWGWLYVASPFKIQVWSKTVCVEEENILHLKTRAFTCLTDPFSFFSYQRF